MTHAHALRTQHQPRQGDNSRQHRLEVATAPAPLEEIQRAIAAPSMETLTPEVVRALQSTHGNAFVSRLVQRASAPPKPLEIIERAPDDVVARELLYRGMIADGNQPRIGNTARELGVRPGEITVEGGDIVPGKGMSTATGRPENLPRHRRGPEFGGAGKDPVWQIDDGEITGDLYPNHDGDHHCSVTASARMPVAQYTAALNATQSRWTRTPAPENTEGR